MINWKDPQKEMPPSGSHIWILLRFPRKETLLSCEIIGVEVCETAQKKKYLVNNDDVNRGTIRWELGDISAWTEDKEINLPERF
jgi:hypothetical protein